MRAISSMTGTWKPRPEPGYGSWSPRETEEGKNEFHWKKTKVLPSRVKGPETFLKAQAGKTESDTTISGLKEKAQQS